jgi:hypothetical protein
LYELEVHHRISSPTRHFLESIALVMSHMFEIDFDREDKWRRNLLIGWFNFECIRPHIASLVICDSDRIDVTTARQLFVGESRREVLRLSQEPGAAKCQAKVNHCFHHRDVNVNLSE